MVARRPHDSILRNRSDELARTVFPLLAAVEGGPFVPGPGLAPREIAYWLLFEVETQLGHSAAIGRDIASYTAPNFRPRSAHDAAVADISDATLNKIPEVSGGSPFFKELGIPFRLYAARASSCSRYVGRGRCAVSGRDEEHCFEVDHLIVKCEKCGGRIVRSEESSACDGCGAQSPPGADQNGADEELIVGYEALADGKAALVIDTEFGMVTPELALRGHTHGVPGLNLEKLGGNDFALKPKPDSDWVEAVVPRDLLWELVRTPPYTTWQGECWLFHCSRPMIFVGEFTPSELRDVDLEEQAAEQRDLLEEDMGPDAEGFMTFRCELCSLHRFHVDVD